MSTNVKASDAPCVALRPWGSVPPSHAGTLDAAAASLSIGAGTDPVNALPDFREAWTVGQVLGSLRRTLALRGAEDDAAGAMRLEALKRCAEIAVTIPKLRVLRAGGLLSPLLTRCVGLTRASDGGLGIHHPGSAELQWIVSS